MINRLSISRTIFTRTNPLKFNCPSGTRVSKILFSSIHDSESAMGITTQQVESALTSKLAPSHMVVIDTSGGCGASFAVEIVSEQFEGKRLLDRHRMVNGALAEEMKEIHALSITKALTPDQWKQQQQDSEKSQAAT